MNLLVCLDRDGTINKDENYFLGSKPNWKEQVEILEGVVEGIKLLNRMHAFVAITTNQSGVALVDPEFRELTEQRVKEVNDYIINRVYQQGARINACFTCPYVDRAYFRKAMRQGKNVDNEYVKDNHPDIKPRIGMIQKAAEAMGKSLEECTIYVIGDRISDVHMGINAGGIGILVPHKKDCQEEFERIIALREENPMKVYCLNNFYEASRYIQKKHPR